MGVTWRNSLFERIQGIGYSGELVVGGLGLLDPTPLSFWTSCPIMVASVDEKYLVALVSVNPGHND